MKSGDHDTLGASTTLVASSVTLEYYFATAFASSSISGEAAI